MFVKENLNPKGKKVSDCVIRAIAKAEDKTWLEVYDDLSVLARKMYSVLNSTDVTNKYLSKYSKIKVKYINDDGATKRYTVNDVCKWDGIYVISVASHLTVVYNHDLYDTWDCGHKSAYIIWKIK